MERILICTICLLLTTASLSAENQSTNAPARPGHVFGDFEFDSNLRKILPDDQSEAAREFVDLEFDILHGNPSGNFTGEEFIKQVYNTQSMIITEDRDPVDVIIRRTTALIEDLKTDQSRLKDFKYLTEKAADIPISDVKARYDIFKKLRTERRKTAFSNPLLKDISKLLFIKREALGFNESKFGSHFCDQNFGFHGAQGITRTKSGLFILEGVGSNKPLVRNLLKNSTVMNGRLKGRKLENGGFYSPALSYDGKQILFAWTEGKHEVYTWNEKTTFHIFKVNADGSNLTMLTDGPVNDYDPCWLPDGRIVFISERRGGFGRCHGRPVPSATLHSMLDDGSDIVTLSPHETNEFNPEVDNNGMIIYTRWDYVDRGFNQAHHAWLTYPDGRDPREINGNTRLKHETSPNMEVDIMPIPGSHKYMAIAAPHHGEGKGTVILINPREKDDGHMSQIKRLTPEQLMPETEFTHNRSAAAYDTPWPLSEKYFLCVYAHDGNGQYGRIDAAGRNFGIYLVDAFGNRELIYRDQEISCLSPIPFHPRHQPPVIPHMTDIGKPRLDDGSKPPVVPKDKLDKFGTVGLINVYNSRHKLPEGIKIKALRIWQIIPKFTPRADLPNVAYGDNKGSKWSLGTVPVEEDGSAYWRQPVNIPVLFHAIDDDGVAVQGMRSATYVKPGETLTCKGCHEERNTAPQQRNAQPLAMKRAPSEIKPDPVDGVNPFNYATLVQPVLERNCVECHNKNKDKKAPDLTAGDYGTNPYYWYNSALTLKKYIFFYNNSRWVTPRTLPGQFGARASKLYKMLKEGHHDVKLSKKDMLSLTIWMDSNGTIYGHEKDIKCQADGQIVFPEYQ